MVESFEQSPTERQKWQSFLRDFGNLFSKGIYGNFGNSLETPEELSKFWEVLDKYPLPTIEENYSEKHWPPYILENILKYCKDIVEEVDVLVRALNNTRDLQEHKKLVNELCEKIGARPYYP